MEPRPVSRCVAIAAHGKRCQQSPFRGSPYCWHHTQSRKIWAPSRPLSAGATRAASARADAAVAEAAAPERRAGAPRRHDDALAGRLIAALGPEKAEELAAFLEAPDPGAFLFLKDEHGLVTESTPPAAQERRTA
jgi:hypothetical protein